jgi:hypothetical protein
MQLPMFSREGAKARRKEKQNNNIALHCIVGLWTVARNRDFKKLPGFAGNGRHFKNPEWLSMNVKFSCLRLYACISDFGARAHPAPAAYCVSRHINSSRLRAFA